jgi:radical SAM protein with 4Fe4S-binding SPASM domain
MAVDAQTLPSVPPARGGDPTLPPLPRRIQVEVTGSCNLACRMCLVRYRPKLGRRQGAMPLDRFRAIVDALPELEEVTLQGLGEPLLAPDLLGMLQHAKARGARAGFNTNGMLLTRAVAARLIDLGVDWIHVSLDGATAGTYEGIRDGADHQLVVANLRGLVEERTARGSRLPRVLLVVVAMRRNVEELPALVQLASSLGVDGVWVQNLSHSFSDTDPAGAYAGIRRFAEAESLLLEPGRAEPLFAEARRAADAAGLELRLPRLQAADPAPGARPAGRPGCDWPFEAAYVTHDGAVQPCCMVMGDDRATLGHVDGTGLGTAWRGRAMRDFRAALLTDRPPTVCEGCSMYRGAF